MYQIKKREQFGPVTFLWEVVAPEVAKSCLPGHFVMVRIDEMVIAGQDQNAFASLVKQFPVLKLGSFPSADQQPG